MEATNVLVRCLIRKDPLDLIRFGKQDFNFIFAIPTLTVEQGQQKEAFFLQAN